MQVRLKNFRFWRELRPFISLLTKILNFSSLKNFRFWRELRLVMELHRKRGRKIRWRISVFEGNYDVPDSIYQNLRLIVRWRISVFEGNYDFPKTAKSSVWVSWRISVFIEPFYWRRTTRSICSALFYYWKINETASVEGNYDIKVRRLLFFQLSFRVEEFPFLKGITTDCVVTSPPYWGLRD